MNAPGTNDPNVHEPGVHEPGIHEPGIHGGTGARPGQRKDGDDAVREYLVPDWNLPARVRVASTTRSGGVGAGPWRSLNLGLGAGDDAAHVAANRARVAADLGLPGAPLWLTQVHGARCVDAAVAAPAVRADASVTCASGSVLAVMTADCLPVVLAAADGDRIGVAHAGWRGLAAGVLECTIAALEVPSRQLHAWLGPRIGAAVYEVGADVVDAFVGRSAVDRQHFQANRADHWLADLGGLARARLERAGVASVSDCGACTWTQPDRFFSYRRDGVTGRMATFAWIETTYGAGRA